LFPLFTDDVVHRWYIAASESGRTGEQTDGVGVVRWHRHEVHLSVFVDLLDTDDRPESVGAGDQDRTGTTPAGSVASRSKLHQRPSSSSAFKSARRSIVGIAQPPVP
jgi:hypothetical protein